MHGATMEGWGEGSGVQSRKSLPLVDVLLPLSLTSVLVTHVGWASVWLQGPEEASVPLASTLPFGVWA